MAYQASAVANALLDRAKDIRPLTQIDIQKLVYFAHGWHLGLKGEPLINELVEAWQYGPVVRSLYSQFRRFGSHPITDKAVEFRINSDGKLATEIPAIPSERPEDLYAQSLVAAICDKYARLAPFKLVELTHAQNSPWEVAWKNKSSLIPNENIKEYFRSLSLVNA